MLVVTRKINEAFLLGEDVKIVILDIDSERVKIGIEAPRSLKILRAELLREVGSLNQEANVADISVLSQLGAATGQTELGAEILQTELEK
ncbi:MAG: carbon storage regulator [Eubacteriales bacterium]|nr:carbon storage regulator [Eubacteriales bacterium]